MCSVRLNKNTFQTLQFISLPIAEQITTVILATKLRVNIEKPLI